MPKKRTCRACHRKPIENGYCDLHKHLHKPKQTKRTDNLQWRSRKGQRLRREYLADHPYCFDCQVMYSRATPATEVHHLVSQIDAPELVFDTDNLLAVCHDCHAARHGGGIPHPKAAVL